MGINLPCKTISNGDKDSSAVGLIALIQRWILLTDMKAHYALWGSIRMQSNSIITFIIIKDWNSKQKKKKRLPFINQFIMEMPLFGTFLLTDFQVEWHISWSS